MKKLAVFIFLALTSSNASSQVTCTDRPECWPEGSSMNTGLLLAKELKILDQRLAHKHHELINLVSSSSTTEIAVDGRLLRALESQQSAWLKYRPEECELIGSLTGSGGTWPSTYATRCEVNHTEQRLRRVKSAIKCIEKTSLETRIVDQNNCLQQLAPLTNK